MCFFSKNMNKNMIYFVTDIKIISFVKNVKIN